MKVDVNTTPNPSSYDSSSNNSQHLSKTLTPTTSHCSISLQLPSSQEENDQDDSILLPTLSKHTDSDNKKINDSSMPLLKKDDNIDLNNDQIQEASPLSPSKSKHRQISSLPNDTSLKENDVKNVSSPPLLSKSKHRRTSSLQLRNFHSAN